MRELPANRGFLIAAGLDDCPTFLEAFAFTDADLAWLADTQGFSSQNLAAFRRLQFTGWAGTAPARPSPLPRFGNGARPVRQPCQGPRGR